MKILASASLAVVLLVSSGGDTTSLSMSATKIGPWVEARL